MPAQARRNRKDHRRDQPSHSLVNRGWLVLLACFPKFSSLIVGMPRPVMAAALFFNGSLMFVAGIQIVASRPITLRASLIVGFSILSALSVMIFPEFYKSLPVWMHQFTDSQITVALITSVLNAIFLLGDLALRAATGW